jgi:hypothetical protein
MAEFAFTDGGIPSAVNWNTNVRDQLTIICTSSTRPSSPTAGRRIYETDTGKEYVYVGSTWTLCGDNAAYAGWTTYTPSWSTGGTQPVIGNGTLTGRYRLTGKTLDLVIWMIAGSTTTFGTAQWVFSIPSGLSHAFYCHGIAPCFMSSNYYQGFVESSGGGLTVWAPTASTPMVAVTATSPAAWAAGHSWYCQIRIGLV